MTEAGAGPTVLVPCGLWLGHLCLHRFPISSDVSFRTFVQKRIRAEVKAGLGPESCPAEHGGRVSLLTPPSLGPPAAWNFGCELVS